MIENGGNYIHLGTKDTAWLPYVNAILIVMQCSLQCTIYSTWKKKNFYKGKNRVKLVH